MPLAFRRRRLTAAALGALPRPEPVRSIHCPRRRGGHEREHQDHAVDRAGHAGNREGLPEPMPGEARRPGEGARIKSRRSPLGRG
jgi:hypothetical protein